MHANEQKKYQYIFADKMAAFLPEKKQNNATLSLFNNSSIKKPYTLSVKGLGIIC